MFAKWVNLDSRFSFSEENNGGVEISADAHTSLFAGQGVGKQIVPDINGYPVLADRPVPTQAQTISACKSALQSVLDAGAQAWGYDSIVTAVSYVGDPDPQFSAEALALRQWRSDVWRWSIAQEASITAGITPAPASVDEFVSSAPVQPARPKVAA